MIVIAIFGCKIPLRRYIRSQDCPLRYSYTQQEGHLSLMRTDEEATRLELPEAEDFF